MLASRSLYSHVRRLVGRSVVRPLSTKLLDDYVADFRDPFQENCQVTVHRSRGGYKISDLDDRHCFLRPGMRILELGAAPGGMTQIIASRASAQLPDINRRIIYDKHFRSLQNDLMDLGPICRSFKAMPAGLSSHVVAVDSKEMVPVPNCRHLQMSFYDPTFFPTIVNEFMGHEIDLVVSDMTPDPIEGETIQEYEKRMMRLSLDVVEFAVRLLRTGGMLIVVWPRKRKHESVLVEKLRQQFVSVARSLALRRGGGRRSHEALYFYGLSCTPSLLLDAENYAEAVQEYETVTEAFSSKYAELVDAELERRAKLYALEELMKKTSK